MCASLIPQLIYLGSLHYLLFQFRFFLLFLTIITTVNKDISSYNKNQTAEDQVICKLLSSIIADHLSESEAKIWHGHPVWFINGNPIVGYSRQKAGLRLMFWSGAEFGDERLRPGTGKFKDASIFYSTSDQIDKGLLKDWLDLARDIQYDYKNIVKRKGKLLKLDTRAAE